MSGAGDPESGGERPGTPSFEARRAAARQRIDAIDDHGLADPMRHRFFHQVYDWADEDAAAVPWADLGPHPLLADFLRQDGLAARDMRALDVGCGLGDNAEALADAGYAVTGFDLVEKAVSWAKRRFPHTRVDYRAADLFALPAEWRGAFDLVHECYTLQALAPRLLGAALNAISDCVAPGGRLLVIARGRDLVEPQFGPPWPIAREEFTGLTAFGFRQASFEDIVVADRGRDVRHFRIVFERII